MCWDVEEDDEKRMSGYWWGLGQPDKQTAFVTQAKSTFAVSELKHLIVSIKN